MAKVTLELSKSRMILVAFLVGEFYRFMVKGGISEISIASQEVADLIDRLTVAIRIES